MPLDNANMPHDGDPFDEHNAQPSCIMFPVGERGVAWETKANGYEKIDSHKAIIRLTNEGDRAFVLGVVGKNYRLVHNKELFERVEHTMRKQMPPHSLHNVHINDRVSGWGRMCYREYIFPNIKCNIGGGSRSDIAFRMIVQNGYGGSALRSHAGAIEFYCTNGMISGEFESTYHKHTSGLVVTGIERAIERALETFASNQTKWKEWAHKPVQHADAMKLFRELANSEKLRENLSTQYMREVTERGNTLWSVYSALTYYASHADGEFKLRSTVEQQNSQAATMLNRELNVAKWLETPAWKQLELA